MDKGLYYKSELGKGDCPRSVRIEAAAYIASLEAECGALRMLVEGKDGLLAAYRIGRPPSEKTWKKLEKAKARLAALEDTDD